MGEAVPPAEGTENYNLLFNSANLLIETWQNEAGVNWNSLWDKVTLDDPVSTQQEFSYDTQLVRKFSMEEDGVKVTAPSGEVAYFTVCKPSELYKGGNRVAQIKKRGVLRFAEAFRADSQFIGGTIEAAYFGFAAKLVDANSEIPVDQPEWLVYMVAAGFAANDYTKNFREPNLIAQATAVMDSMKSNNEEEQDATMSHGDWTPLSETT